MTEEQRKQEIHEVMELLNELAALSHFEIANPNGIPVVFARFERSSDQVEPVPKFVEIASSKPG